MFIVGLSVVRNECDVIEQFVRHNLRYMDALVVLDNASTDGTREVLDALAREGLPLRVDDDPEIRHAHAEKISALLHCASSWCDPEAVLALDADEFLRVGSRGRLEAALSNLQPDTVGLLGWMTYLYAPLSVETSQGAFDDPVFRMVRRRCEECPSYYKVALPRPSQGWTSVFLDQGNHGARIVSTDGSLSPLPARELEGLGLAHFPVRSSAQFTSKVVGGWLAYLAYDHDAASKDLNYQWRDNYKRIVASPGRPLDDQDLLGISLGYAQTNVPALTHPDVLS